MQMESIGAEFRRIDRSWMTFTWAEKRVALARLAALEQGLVSKFSESNSGRPELARAIRMLRGKVEQAIAVERHPYGMADGPEGPRRRA